MGAYLPRVLSALATTSIDCAKQQQRNLKAPEVIEEIAQGLYRRHRNERTARVRERTWDQIPRSERGKYLKIVRKAIARFRTT